MYIVINGGGKVASYLARVMLEKGHDVALIEKRPEVAQKLISELPQSALIIVGDGCDSRYQEDAGTAHADIFVATTGEDEDNLVSCELASVSFNVPRVIARVNNPKNEKIFEAVGIEAIASTTIISRMIEEEATVGDIRTLMSLRKGDLSIVEVELPKNTLTMGDGRKVAEIKLPKSSVLAARVRAGDVETIHGETMLIPGDTVIALTKRGFEAELKKALTGK